MRQRTSKYVIRIALILLAFQFIAPAFFTIGGEQNFSYTYSSATLHKSGHQSLTICSLFERTENEVEEEFGKLFTAELLNFSISYNNRIAASQAIAHSYNAFSRIQQPALTDLYCIYLI